MRGRSDRSEPTGKAVPRSGMRGAQAARRRARNGEGLSVEFKRCSGRIEHDVFETICAFLNRFGGDLLLGVEDDGTVVGVGGDAVALRNNIMNTANDERVFDPVVYLDPKIVEYDGRTIIHIHVPASGDVHAYKGVVYDRNGDADVRVRSVSAKGLMILRKQSIFTEQRIYPKFVSWTLGGTRSRASELARNALCTVRSARGADPTVVRSCHHP